jgi:hypothetical protein
MSRSNLRAIDATRQARPRGGPGGQLGGGDEARVIELLGEDGHAVLLRVRLQVRQYVQHPFAAHDIPSVLPFRQRGFYHRLKIGRYSPIRPPHKWRVDSTRDGLLRS